MRLIDADALLVNMDKGMQGTAREYLKFYQMAVNDEPTAYDVNKVVEQLEKEKENSYYEATSKGHSANGTSIAYGENIAYQKALKIVKAEVREQAEEALKQIQEGEQ